MTESEAKRFLFWYKCVSCKKWTRKIVVRVCESCADKSFWCYRSRCSSGEFGEDVKEFVKDGWFLK